MRIARGSVIALAGLVGAGVLAWPATGADAGSDEVAFKRQETDVELVAADDPDDDDTSDRTRSRGDSTRNGIDTHTGDERSRVDDTRGNITSDNNSRDSVTDDPRDQVSRDANTRTDSTGTGATRGATRDATRG